MNRVADDEAPDELEEVARKRLTELDRESELVDDDIEADVESRLEDLGYL